MIEQIHNSNLFGVVVEIGCGCPVANTLLNVVGASKTIYKTEVPYNKEVLQNEYGVSGRAVSQQTVSNIIGKHKQHNFVYASSFQVGEDISTHGWIGLKTNDITRYYHVSIYNKYNRVDYINIINNVGIGLILKQSGIDSTINVDYIDCVIDENNSYLIEETINYINNSTTPMLGVFNVDGTIGRFEDVFRDKKEVSIFKGSFNPPTKAHQAIFEYKPNVYANISVNTKDKGYQSSKSIKNRILMLNKMGYNVIINNKPLFIDLIELIRIKYHEKINFLMGDDTFKRLSEDYDYHGRFDKSLFLVQFYNCNIFIAERNNVIDKSLIDILDLKIFHPNMPDISSTNIRENNNTGFLPESIVELYHQLTNEK